MTEVVEVAGTYDRQYGNYAKWRGTASVGWAMEPFSALGTWSQWKKSLRK